MNILQIGTTDKRGGAAAVAWRLKDEAEKTGHAVSMFVADKLSDDKNVFVIPRKKIRRYLGFLLSIEDLYDSDWILDTEQFKNADLIHCHNIHGRFFNLNTLRKMSEKKPVVWTLHDEWAITPHCAYTYETEEMKDGFWQCPSKEVPPRLLWHNERFLRWRKMNIYLKTKMTIVTPSSWLKNRVEKSVLGNKDVNLIYNGINTGVFKRYDKTESRGSLGLPENKNIILFLADGGKENPFKGWEFVEKVMDHYKEKDDMLFLCVGNHNGVEVGNRDNIKYIKHVDSQDELAKYYSASDMLLHSSTADNFPLVVLEAMSCGLPIVAFNVGGVPEVVAHKENGYIADYKDINDLIKGVGYVLNLDDGSRKKMSADSIEKVAEGFTVEKMIKKYFDLYNSLIKAVKNN